MARSTPALTWRTSFLPPPTSPSPPCPGPPPRPGRGQARAGGAGGGGAVRQGLVRDPGEPQDRLRHFLRLCRSGASGERLPDEAGAAGAGGQLGGRLSAAPRMFPMFALAMAEFLIRCAAAKNE